MTTADQTTSSVGDLIDALVEDVSRLPRGARIASESELMARFGVSRGPLRSALARLEARHVITRRRGLGSFVGRPYDYVLAEDTASLHQQIMAAGGEVRTVPLGTTQVTPPEWVAAWLGVTPGESVTRLERLGYIDGEAAVHLCEFFAPGVLMDVGVAAQAFESVRDILSSLRFDPRRARCRCTVDAPPLPVRRHLDLGAGETAWRVDSQLVDAASGRPLVVSHNHSRPDQIRMIVEYSVDRGEHAPRLADD